MNRLLKTGLISLGSAIAGVTAYSVINACKVSRTEYYIFDDRFKEDFKILFMSDIHFGEGQPRNVFRRLIDRLNREAYDLVLIGGDTVNERASKDDVDEVLRLIGSLRSLYGIYAVYGNHDGHIRGDVHLCDYVEKMQNYGITLLQDSYSVIAAPMPIMLIGRDCYRDHVDSRLRLHEIMGHGDLADGMYKICLDHVPKYVEAASLEGVDLLLNGHTHGGQLFPIEQYMKMKGEYTYGYQVLDCMSHIITSGVGVSPLPVRNAHNCEYVIINISDGGTI